MNEPAGWWAILRCETDDCRALTLGLVCSRTVRRVISVYKTDQLVSRLTSNAEVNPLSLAEERCRTDRPG
jgi:tRNA/tmRNA/rRNA uracil-C5-methylase (TrmA/RlmC/RlmD family)